MSKTYTHIVDLAKVAELPADGIHSRTLYNDDDLKAVIFGFAEGEELSEHTASMPAILHCIKGEVTLTLGEDTVAAQE
jgi:quercetin dioxygenase-like cupin family protein